MVLCSGAFDGLHSGHAAYFAAAKALCRKDELLICAVAPDAYVASKGRALRWRQADRVETVLAIGAVDGALTQRALSAADLILEHRPRLFVKGTDWTDRIPEQVQAACRSVGTDISFVNTERVHVSQTPSIDDEALAALESLMLTQRPATIPWAPVTDYSWSARVKAEGSHPDLIAQQFRPTFALDVGCGPGHLVRMLCERGVPCVGVDVQPIPPALYLDIAATEMPAMIGERESRPDLVICREVLEHLTMRQLMRAVRNVCTLTSRYLYITTRFAKAPAHLFSVDTRDELDPTHITMVNQVLLRALIVLHGLRRRTDHESALDWQHKGRCLVYEKPC